MKCTLEVQPLAFEGEFQVREITLARPVGSRIRFFHLRRRGVSLARTVGDKGFYVVGQAVERMPLP